MNLTKELEKVAQVQRKELNEIQAITDVNRLLAERGQEDVEILRSMGIKDIEKVRKDTLRGRKIELETAQKKYKSVYTIDEIKAIAIKYGLRFLRTEKYAGVIDGELLKKIKDFSKEDNVPLNSYNLQYRFFILAPKESFNLEEKPRPPKGDPIMFYDIDGKHFRLIHQWGDDLTWERRIIGAINKSEGSYVLSRLLIVALIVIVPLIAISASLGAYIFFLAIAEVITLFVAVSQCMENNFEPHHIKWNTSYK